MKREQAAISTCSIPRIVCRCIAFLPPPAMRTMAPSSTRDVNIHLVGQHG